MTRTSPDATPTSGLRLRRLRRGDDAGGDGTTTWRPRRRSDRRRGRPDDRGAWSAVEPTEDGVPVAGSAHLALVSVARAVLLTFCAALLSVSARLPELLPSLLTLGAVALLASLPLRREVHRRAQPLGEGLLAGVLATSGDGLLTPLIPYLLAAPLAAGLGYGVRHAVATTGLTVLASAGALVALSGGAAPDAAQVAAAVQWTFTMLAVALLASWVRGAHLSEGAGLGDEASYESAYRLISQLRVVARQLSSGLDTVTLAQSLLQTIQAHAAYDRGALYVRSPGGVLVPLAYEGVTVDPVDPFDGTAGTPSWPAPTRDGLLDAAWASDAPQQQPVGVDGREGRWSAAVPLRIGLRTFGVVAVESSSGPFDDAELLAAMRLTEDGALRLETALLFEEVRSLATVEERRRVAREIHDGIAQELASLGYLVDDLAARSGELPDVAEDLRHLRTQLTQTITELRLSIFDLRSEVQPTVGLGTALSDYVRQVGAGSNIIVHLVLDEAPQRLRVETETELLRIAQEAITNARKHAGARNLWVTCRVDPPRALVRVEDDGIGLGPARPDSFGIDIMRERATRCGGALSVRDRAGGGTVVEVTISQA